MFILKATTFKIIFGQLSALKIKIIYNTRRGYPERDYMTLPHVYSSIQKSDEFATVITTMHLKSRMTYLRTNVIPPLLPPSDTP